MEETRVRPGAEGRGCGCGQVRERKGPLGGAWGASGQGRERSGQGVGRAGEADQREPLPQPGCGPAQALGVEGQGLWPSFRAWVSPEARPGQSLWPFLPLGGARAELAVTSKQEAQMQSHQHMRQGGTGPPGPGCQARQGHEDEEGAASRARVWEARAQAGGEAEAIRNPGTLEEAHPGDGS